MGYYIEMTSFPFNDLHSFKDFVVFAQICSPDEYPQRDGVLAKTPWTLELVFEGLRRGLDMAVQEKGQRKEFSESRRLIEDAYEAYKSGDIRTGFMKLEQVEGLLRKVPSQ
jgi:hypothetical protein